ncbi:MAG: Pycsar system effector family protein [Bacteroidota bacterium]
MTAEIQITKELWEATKAYAIKLLTEELPANYQYHTLSHTEQVVAMVEQIGRPMGLDDDQIHLIQIAAWLHDVGYVRKYIGHEDESQKMTRKFLESQKAEDRLIDRVIELIEATRLDVEPRNTLEAVLKDADLSNLATEDALINSELIRQEWKTFCDRQFTDEEWDRFNYRFFKDHAYYTNYAKEVLQPQKKANTKKIKKAIKKREKEKANVVDVALMNLEMEKQESQIDKLQRKLKKAKNMRPDRGIETMFRTTYRTHINLSDLADSKANILLSINAIVISIIFTNIFANKDSSEFMILPSFMLLTVCMITIVFAILATRPKVNSGIFSREDILQRKTNLLFFGNFHKMDLDDYMWGINEMMHDAEYLYGSMSKDIYFLGKVLARKFRLLRIAYNIFMYGIGGSLVILLGSYFYFAYVLGGA